MQQSRNSYVTVKESLLTHVAERIEFRCGAPTFIMKSDGTIELSGLDIKVNGRRAIIANAGRIDLN